MKKIKGELGYKLIVCLFNGILKRVRKYTVIHPEKLPSDDGFIVIANHRDYWDYPIVCSIFGTRPVHPLGKAELKKQFSGKILAFMGAVFVDRTCEQSRKRSRVELINILKGGRNILLCPEGTRNKTNEILLPFAGHGAVSIAQKSERPIIPIALSPYGAKGEKRLVQICDPFLVGIDDDLGVANNDLWNCLYNALLSNNEIIKSMN